MKYIIFILLLLGSLILQAQNPPNPMAYWKLDESSGNAIDEVGANDGIISGATQGVSGKINTGYSFGGDGDMVTFPDNADMSMYNTSFTWLFWVKSTDFDDGGSKVAVLGGDVGAAAFCVRSDTRYPQFTIVNVADATMGNVAVPNDGNYHQIGLSFNNTTNSGTYWIDGASAGTFSGFTDNVSQNSASNLLGKLIAGSTTSRWNGSIDEVYIAKVVLTVEEVGYSYNSGVGKSYPWGSPPSGNDLWIDGLNGDDANTGLTSSDPIRTFGKAETILGNSFEYVHIANGNIYYESFGINSITKDHGNPLTITTWYKYGNDDVDIRGLTQVTSWTDETGDYWTKTLTGMPKNPNIIYPYYYGATHLNGVYINGIYYAVSRYPNGTYNYKSMESSGTGYLVDNQEVRAADYWNTGWIVTLLPGAEWVNTKLYITDFSSTIYSYNGLSNDEDNWNRESNGLKYFIQNHHNAEDVNGEWTQNYSNNKLEIYYTGNLNNESVYVPLVDSVIGITNSSHIILKHVNLYGANKTQIRVYNSVDILIDSCTFNRAPVAAVGVFTSDTVTVQNSIFNLPNDNGIVGRDNDYEVYTKNYIKGAGVDGLLGGDRLGGHLNGIDIESNHGDVYITYNWIDSTGYCGILATGLYSDMGYLNNDHIYVEHNWIDHAKMLLDDGGAIYISGYNTQGHLRRVRGNIITNEGQNTAFNITGSSVACGSIYLDAWTRQFLIDSNAIYNTNMGFFFNGYQLTTGKYTSRDNIVVSTKGVNTWMDYGFKYKTQSDDDHVDTLRFTKTKMVMGPTATGGGIWMGSQDAYSEWYNVVDSNDYYDPFNYSPVYPWVTSVGPPTWTFTNRELSWVQANTSWEDHSTVNKNNWDYGDVAGITQAEFIQFFINWSYSAHEFDLGNVTLKDLDGTNHTTSITVPAYKTMTLFYVSGTLSTMDDNIYIDLGGPPPPPPTTYYVSPTGSDANPGTIDEPFLNIDHAVNLAVAGNIVWVRGGHYDAPSPVSDSNGYASYRIRFRHGQPGNPIRVYAYPGETPVFDFSGATIVGQRFKGMSIKGCSQIIFKGLHLTGATQVSASVVAGMWAEEVDTCTWEQCDFYHNQGPGFYIWGAASEGNWVHNCDFYDNYDPMTSGGNADGLDFCRIDERAGNERKNKVSGCRAYYNSDDGFDFVINPGYLYVDSCWAYKNGRSSGNANGFKLGENDGTPESNTQRYIKNCLSFYNGHHGYTQNESYVKMNLFNNISYHNGMTGYYFTWHDVIDTFRNCISLGDANTLVKTGTLTVDDHNTWNGGVTVSDADFVSVDSTGVSGPRGSNGSLPNLDFLKLTMGSDLIDAGIDVGISYYDLNPDIGAFEYYNYIPPGGSYKKFKRNRVLLILKTY